MAEIIIRRGLEEPDTSGNFVPHKPQRPEKLEPGRPFKVVSEYQPAGDQPAAIADLVAGAREGDRTQVLLGVTGSGKTFTMAKVIEELQRPALIPLVTLFGVMLPALVGGSVVVERIFGIPGMGLLAWEAVTGHDVPVVMAVVSLSAVVTMLGYLAADLLYAWVDPRVRSS